ncbi:MAG: protein kinase domain-containing protein, partial [Acidimicrobiia bacterium]
YDAFPVVDGSGAGRVVKYLLVFDWLEEGTVDDALVQFDDWPEDEVVAQVGHLLRVLQLLHRAGICHGDITPRNVFIRNGQLLLGDLGIAKQSLHAGLIPMSGAAPDAFVPPDRPEYLWSPSDDVYQVGLLALSLLAGQVATTWDMSGKTLKHLGVSDAVKGWIRDACGPAEDRFRDAHEALGFLTGEPIRPARAPRSLKGQCVVFTGILDLRRDDARALARAAGASVQGKVNGATTLIVAGEPNPLQIGQQHGTKLFDAHRRIRRGQPIAIIDGKRFSKLAAR